jgi:predicted alpha/beta superfamily hydrolase
VQTNVPEAVAGAKDATVEHIKIHGAALEGNLECDAADRDVIVFLPPSYQKDKKRRYPVVYALHGYSIGAEPGRTRSASRKRSKVPLRGTRRR